MAATRKSLVIEQKATFRLKLTWRDSKKRPINLTGYSARMQVRATATDVSTLLDLSTNEGDIELGGAAGTIIVVISDTETAGLAWTEGVYDIVLTSPEGVRTRLLEGKITVSPGVTTP